jgi:hypothetical protein
MPASRLSPDRVLSQAERSARWRQRRAGLLPPVPPRPPRPPQPEWVDRLLSAEQMCPNLKTYAEMLAMIAEREKP